MSAPESSHNGNVQDRTPQQEAPVRGRSVKGRRALDSLPTKSRTTGKAAAARSRLVRRLRLALPALAIVLFAAFIFNTRSNTVDQAFLDDFEDISAATDELRMANPRFSGIDAKGKPFEITAVAAKQHPGSRDVVSLEKPKAIQGGGNEKTVVTAESGIYRSEPNILELSNGVELQHDIADGSYLFRSPSATVSIQDEIVTSDAGVGGQGPDGSTLKADRMKAYNAEGRVILEGNVSMRIYPKKKPPSGTDNTIAAHEQ